tara:strand:+ start:3689 stop:4144 length:456 start_codon:yes stop_codon:yes gene_type:complete
MIEGVYSVLYIKWQGVFLPIGCLTSDSFIEDIDTLDVNRSSTYRGSIPTNQSYNISFDGLVIGTSNTGGDSTKISLDRLTNLKTNRTLIEWKTEASNSVFIDSGFGYITNLSKSSNIDEFISFNATIQGFGIPSSYSLLSTNLQNELEYTL